MCQHPSASLLQSSAWSLRVDWQSHLLQILLPNNPLQVSQVFLKPRLPKNLWTFDSKWLRWCCKRVRRSKPGNKLLPGILGHQNPLTFLLPLKIIISTWIFCRLQISQMRVPTARESSGPAITQSLPGLRKTPHSWRKPVSLGDSCLSHLFLHFQQHHLCPGLRVGLCPRAPTCYKVQGWGSCRHLCLPSIPEMLLVVEAVPRKCTIIKLQGGAFFEGEKADFRLLPFKGRGFGLVRACLLPTDLSALIGALEPQRELSQPWQLVLGRNATGKAETMGIRSAWLAATACPGI